MSLYRLYFLDSHGHIRAATDLECQSDEEARQSAEDLHDGRPMELWCATRVVARIPARPVRSTT